MGPAPMSRALRQNAAAWADGRQRRFEPRTGDLMHIGRCSAIFAGVSYEHDIFISYPRAGPIGRWVREVFDRELRAWLPMEIGERRVFRDVPGLEPGVRWPEEIERALLRSKCIIAVLAPPYFHRPWCLAEWHTMRAREAELRAGGARIVRASGRRRAQSISRLPIARARRRIGPVDFRCDESHSHRRGDHRSILRSILLSASRAGSGARPIAFATERASTRARISAIELTRRGAIRALEDPRDPRRRRRWDGRGRDRTVEGAGTDLTRATV